MKAQTAESAAAATAVAAAAAAKRLVYLSDDSPGITRVRRGSQFVYRNPDGSALRDPAELQRIRSLAIPPAYTKVWIAPRSDGHLQATGRDARGRKQYRYHPQWRLSRELGKFDRMLDFAAVLPRLRARVSRDLTGPGTGRSTLLAALVRLLDTTLVRIGNEEYARTNGSFGLTTLRQRHAAVRGSRLMLRFRGKSGVLHELSLDDPKVARVVRRCQALPGQALFQHVDDAGEPHGIGSADVNEYLRDATGGDFTAKDFRTWHASVHAFSLAQDAGDVAQAQRAGHAKKLLAEVAGRLGNTVAVCRKSYVHPQVLSLMLGESSWLPAVPDTPKRGLSRGERNFVAFLAKAG